MSNVIHLLEKMGQNAEFRYAKAEALTELMADTDPALVRAVIAGDQEALEAMLGARSKIVCMVYPVDEPQQEDKDDEKEEDKILLMKVC